MYPFSYYNPENLTEFLELLEKHKHEDAKVIAGGTDLIPLLRSSKIIINHVIDANNTGFNQIVDNLSEIRIGSLVTFNALIKNELIKKELPVLKEASSKVGAVQTRNIATIGGNLCSAVPSLDAGPPLMVLNANLRILSFHDERIVPIEEFFIGPRKTVLEKNEFLAEIIIPKKAGYATSFIKFGRRKALTLAIVNVAVAVKLDKNNRIEDCRISLGAVAPTPIRAYKAEENLIGQNVSEGLLEEAGIVASEEISPISDLRASADYRRHLTKVLVKRALKNAIRQTEKGGELFG